MRFCQAFMSELYRHIGPNTDVPAGDIGVGGREIGFLFGQYKRLRNEFTGVLTGKGLNWGGSLIRPEATGYGAVYFAAEMLATRGETLEGQDRASSAARATWPSTPSRRSTSSAARRSPSPTPAATSTTKTASTEKLAFVMELKNVRRGRIKEYADKFPSAVFTARDDSKDFNPLWDHKADCAFPCATQNEINAKDAQNLVKNGVYVVTEGANMPTVPEGVELFVEKKLLYGPGKAANAGGVATSGLEMTQNSLRLNWTREEVDARLHGIMKAIHKQCINASAAYGFEGNYVAGANIAGFLKVADAMLDQGVVPARLRKELGR